MSSPGRCCPYAVSATIDLRGDVGASELVTGGNLFPFEAADQSGALGLVRNGLGVALLPRAGSEEQDLRVTDIRDVDLDLRVALAVSHERPPAAATAALIDAILSAAGRRI